MGVYTYIKQFVHLIFRPTTLTEVLFLVSYGDIENNPTPAYC